MLVVFNITPKMTFKEIYENKTLEMLVQKIERLIR